MEFNGVNIEEQVQHAQQPSKADTVTSYVGKMWPPEQYVYACAVGLVSASTCSIESIATVQVSLILLLCLIQLQHSKVV